MEFKSWRSFWIFERNTKTNFRYNHDEETRRFLETVLHTSKSRIEDIPSGSHAFRAQIGHSEQNVLLEDGDSYDVEIPYPSERMKPLRGKASDGRANPRGIPVLYLASDLKTALSEVRPCVGTKCTVGVFKINKSLKIIDFSRDSIKNPIFLEEPSKERKESIVWGYINKAFSMPISNNELFADYAPTQIITELFKINGYDGIAYKSSLGPGHNVALFNPDCADIVTRHVYEIKSVEISEEEIRNPYTPQMA